MLWELIIDMPYLLKDRGGISNGMVKLRIITGR